MANPWYLPNQKIMDVHGWNRPNAADGMHLAPNTFNPDFKSDQGKLYSEGILSLAAIYFVLGALLFVAFVVVNTLACCCRSRGLKNKHRGSCEKCCKCFFNPSGWFVIGVLIMIGLTSAAIANLGNFKSTVRTTTNSLNGIDNLLSKASTQVNGNLTTSLNAVDNGLSALLATAQANNAPQAMLDQITSFQGYSASAILYTTTLGGQLNTTVNSFGDAIGGGDLDADKLSKQVYVGAAASLGLFLVFLLLVSLSLMKKPCCAFVFRACNILVILSFLFVFIFAGLMLTVGLVGSDACVAPSQSIASIMNLTNVQNNLNSKGGVDATNTLLYVTTCQNKDGSVNPPTSSSGAYYQLAQGEGEFTTLQTSFASFAQTYGNNPTYASNVATINGALATTSASIYTLNTYASCLPINTIYQNMVISLCNTGIAEGILNVWSLSTAACVIFLILTISSSRLAWRHPGDPLDEDNGDAGLTIVYNAAQGRGKPGQPQQGAVSPLGSGPNYSSLPAGPVPSGATTAAGSGKAGAYASEWR